MLLNVHLCLHLIPLCQLFIVSILVTKIYEFMQIAFVGVTSWAWIYEWFCHFKGGQMSKVVSVLNALQLAEMMNQ